MEESPSVSLTPWVIQPLEVSLTCLELILGGSSALAGYNLMVFNVEFGYVGGRLLFWIGLQRGENFMTLRWKALFFLMLLWWNKYVIIVRLCKRLVGILMISLEKGRLKGPCSLLEMVSTRGYSLLVLGLVDIPVRNVYHDSNGKGELLLSPLSCILEQLAVFIYVFQEVYLLWTGLLSLLV